MSVEAIDEALKSNLFAAYMHTMAIVAEGGYGTHAKLERILSLPRACQ